MECGSLPTAGRPGPLFAVLGWAKVDKAATALRQSICRCRLQLPSFVRHQNEERNEDCAAASEIIGNCVSLRSKNIAFILRAARKMSKMMTEALETME